VGGQAGSLRLYDGDQRQRAGSVTQVGQGTGGRVGRMSVWQMFGG
jgi:hypothetical protein